MPENQITDHWLLRGIQSAIFYYFSCGPCIVVETKWRRQSQARRERKQRQRARKEKMEYRKRKQQQGETEDEDDNDNVVEMEVTDPTGTSRVIGVGLTGGAEEHIFLPFEVNEFWGDESNPSSELPWWWKRLTGVDPNVPEPVMPVGQRGVGRKRYFTPTGERDWQSENPEVINRDDGDIWPLNESHPPVLCKGEITKEEAAWIKESPPSPSTMRRIQGTVYEVDLDKLIHTKGYNGPITSHPAVSKVEFGNQRVERHGSKSTHSSKSATTSPKTKTTDFERKHTEKDGSIGKRSPSLSHTSEKLLSPPTPTLEGIMAPTARPDSAVSASRLKKKAQGPTRIRSGSHTGSSASEDADDEDEDSQLSPKTIPLTKPKPSHHRSVGGKTSAASQRTENISPRASPQTIGSAVSSSDSLAGDNWLPPKMFGAKPTSNNPTTVSGSSKVR